jgi:hypothetical protein
MEDIIKIPNIKTFRGSIPTGYDLVVYETNTNPKGGYVLHGFDEIGDDFGLTRPAYCFIKG